jgi:histone acetyltransferase
MYFSLEDAQEDDDDEDGNELSVSQIGSSNQPHSSRRAKKGHKTQAGTAPASKPPPTGLALAEMNGQITYEELRIKVEDKMDEGQLNRLATGVTVDTDTVSATVRAIVTSKYGIMDSHTQ